MKWVWRIAGVIAVVLVVAVGALAWMSSRPDAGRVQASIVIARSPQGVWPWLHEPGKLKQWISWMVAAEQPDGLRPGAETVWTMEDRNNNNALMKISGRYQEIEPSRRLRMQLASGDQFTGSAEYRLTALSDGTTRVESDTTYQMNSWLFKLLLPVVVPQATAKLESDLAQLKRLVEKQP